jgi:hypothetical protein
MTLCHSLLTQNLWGGNIGVWGKAMNRDLDFLYHSLLLAMGQEYEHYQELLKTLQEETSLFKNSTLADILEFNNRKEFLLFSLNMAEETRTEMIKKTRLHDPTRRICSKRYPAESD